MREPKTLRIDGEEYTFTCLRPTKSLRVLTKLLKLVIGPAASALDSADSLKSAFADIELGTLLGGMVDRLDEDEILEIISTFAEVTLVGGQKLSAVFDAHFGGKPLLLLKVTGKALEVEYADFFGPGGVSGLINTLEQKQKNMQDSSPAKTT